MSKEIKVTSKNGKLLIELDMNETAPPDSKSGKTLLVASSGGNQKTEIMVKGKPLYVGVSAFIHKDK